MGRVVNLVRNIKLKDGSIIIEQQKGVFSIIFPNKHYIIITTWTGKVEVSAPLHGDFEMGEIQA